MLAARFSESPSGRQTLDGLVFHCFIDGKILKGPGDIDGDGIAVMPMKILAMVYTDHRQLLGASGFPRYLLAFAGSFMTMYVVHCLAVKLCAVFRWILATRGHGPVVAFAKVELMIDLSVEMIRPVIPRPRPDENTAREPLRAIVAIRRAAIRSALVVPVRTHGRYSNADRNLRGCLMSRDH
jgi:hypothetical protein